MIHNFMPQHFSSSEDRAFVVPCLALLLFAATVQAEHGNASTAWQMERALRALGVDTSLIARQGLENQQKEDSTVDPLLFHAKPFRQ